MPHNNKKQIISNVIYTCMIEFFWHLYVSVPAVMVTIMFVLLPRLKSDFCHISSYFLHAVDVCILAIYKTS